MGEPLTISSLPMNAAPPAPRGARMLDIAEVARRLNITERQARTRCAKEWFPLGLASIQPAAPGRKPSWHVRDDADPLLARAVFPEHLKFDQRQLTTAQRAVLQWRHKVYIAWREEVGDAIRAGRTSDEASAVFIVRLSGDPYLTPPAGASIPKTPRTLWTWHAAYRESGLAGLVDERWLRKADTSDGLDHPFFAEVKRLFLDKRQPSLTYVHRMVSATFARRGEPILRFKKCQRLMSRIPKAAKIKFRKGEEAYVNEAEPHAILDYSGLRSNQMWVGDHSRFDVIVAHRGKRVRPWLTAWEDVRSRMIVGYCVFVGDPNTDTIILALRRGMKAHGVPEVLLTDNGKDYQSKPLNGTTRKERQSKQQFGKDVDASAGLLAGLDIRIRHARVRHPQSKPIERLFGTMESQFGKWQATYCGGSPETKPDDLAAKLARGAAPALSDFIAAFDEWVVSYNHGHAHHGNSMEGRSPAEVFAACLTSKRVAPDAVLDSLTLKPVGLFTVHQNGVVFKGLWYDGDGLWKRLGEKVELRIDVEDVRVAQIHDEHGRFLCIARPRGVTGFVASLAELKEVHREKGVRRRQIAEFHQSRPRVAEDPARALMEIAARREASANVAAPASIRIDGIEAVEAAKAARAMERQKAAEPRLPARKMFDLVKAAAELPDPVPRMSFHSLMENHLRRQAEEEAAAREADSEAEAAERARMADVFGINQRNAS